MENAPNFEPRDFYFKNHVIFLLFSLPWFFPSLQLFLTKIIQKLALRELIAAAGVLGLASNQSLEGAKGFSQFLEKDDGGPSNFANQTHHFSFPRLSLVRYQTL